MESDDKSLPRRLQKALLQQVRPDEQIRWIGQPGPPIGHPSERYFLFFAIEWTLLSCLFTVGAVFLVAKGGKQGDPFWSQACLALFGIPFLLFGIWMMTARTRARRRLRNTVYVVTDQRAIVIECRHWGTTTHSFKSDQLDKLSFIERPSGYGDVILSENIKESNEGLRLVTRIGFMNIPDARRIEGIVKELSLRSDEHNR